VLDAAECPPTYGTKPFMVQGIIAGGWRALRRSVEGAEDRPSGGRTAIDRAGVGPRDTVVGIAACGLTPFVRAAVSRARRRGAKTVFVTCAPETRGGIAADIVINPVTGPEVITGSTRMKAGTATKLVLNAITTAAMILIGKTYGNLMVDLKATNEKLRDRSERIMMEATGLGRLPARRLLKNAGGSVKTAILMHTRSTGRKEAERRLKRAGGFLRRAMEI
jgi:N-acetylmuramic acid 6-phosphate etherase